MTQTSSTIEDPILVEEMFVQIARAVTRDIQEPDEAPGLCLTWPAD